MELLIEIRRYLTRPRVRPWALAVPILTLLICLPMLRPLRHPDPRHISDEESVRLATIEAIVEQRTLALNQDDADAVSSHIIRVGDQYYSDQPPVMALLLAGPYWVMRQAGVSMASNPNLAVYLLTVLGATLPIALAGGLVYRMGRVFELRRPLRTGLALAVVLATGLLSYGVVLNSHAAGASLLLCATGCLIHVASSNKAAVSGSWLAIGGFAAALAAVIEPAAIIFFALLAIVPLAMRWRPSLRLGGLLLFLIGSTPPLVLHAVLTIPVTGDLLPGRFHPELLPTSIATNPLDAAQLAGLAMGVDVPQDPEVTPFDVEDAQAAAAERASFSAVFWRNMGRIWSALCGSHGILSHFPVIIFGIAGVFAVMHRHWPSATKFLAAAALVGGVIVILACTVVLPDTWAGSDLFFAGTSGFGYSGMFGPEPFLVFLPVLLFWSGAWLRRRHHLAMRVVAGCFLAFSVFVTVVGMSDPFPRGGYDRYTVAEAVDHLLTGNPRYEEPEAIAGNSMAQSVP